MKCLDKERSRRYETANGLARDLERYLHDDVVEARPPSASYRLRKFIRKHRVGISTVLAFVGLLIAAAGISTMLAIKARRAELEATRNAHDAGDNLKRARAAELGLADKLAEAKLRASSLQIDVDLAEIKIDRRIGLLKLARTLKAMNDSKAGPIQSDPADQARRELREFATMAVLAYGQAFATLLPPFSHDGYPIRGDFTSRSKPRLLTSGSDGTARLWDLCTGKQVAILRRKNEKVLGAGLSPSGATAFTDCSDGVVRLWDTPDGSFRAETDARPERWKNINLAEFDSYHPYFLSRAGTQLSDDRVLTREDAWRFNPDEPSPHSGGRPKSAAELWDAKTGRFVARLDLPRGDGFYQFIGNGRWIAAEQKEVTDSASALRIDPDQSLHIFSAADGRPIAELKQAALARWGDSEYVSPSGRIMATFHKKRKPEMTNNGQVTDAPGDLYVELWDTVSWKSRSVSGPFAGEGVNDWNRRIRLLTEDLFALGYDLDFLGPTILVRASATSPVAVLREQIIRVNMDRALVMVQSAQLFETRNWRRVQPPKGRRYHPDVALCAPDGRFAVICVGYEPTTEIFVDSVTDKTFESTGESSWTYVPGAGRSSSRTHGKTVWVQRLPPPDHLDISPDLIELWAQVVVCGELDDGGGFTKWDEPSWEKKRQELAAVPAPYPDFSFPGHAANDRLHWLRQEFENANGADKPRFAQQLLERADAVGDKSEGARWLDELKEASWAVAVRPNAEEEDYRRALRWAEAAVRHVPEAWDIVHTLGMLKYRNGLYKEAIATLMRSHEANRKSKTGPRPSGLAFLAMAHHALGESDKAHDYLRRLTTLCEQPAWKDNEVVTGFLKEARQRLATPR